MKMKKLLLSITLLCIVVINTMAADVTITMNATSRNIKLTNKQTGDPVDVGTMITSPNYTYSFTADPGDYILTAFQSNGTTSNGSIELAITDETVQVFQFYTIIAGATNSGWVVDTDYTVSTSLVSRDGASRTVTIGESTTTNRITFMVYKGDTYYVQFIPNAAHAAEGYLTYSGSATVTANATKSALIPMGYTCSVTIPKEATLFMGTKKSHFQKYDEVMPTSKVESDGTTVYNFTLGEKLQYNYRVSQSGRVPYTTYFTMPSAVKDILITSDSLSTDVNRIDHDVTSNKGYNVADVFLNINEKGHLKLAKNDTYQLVNLRNWSTVESFVNAFWGEPDYHYTVVNENGNLDNSVVTVSDEGKITAVDNGTAIVLVTYDAIYVPSAMGGAFWGAIWPENTGVFVVSVGSADSGITSNMLLNEDFNTPGETQKLAGLSVDAELDIFYYLESEGGFDYTFTPTGSVTSVTMAQPTVGVNSLSYSGFSANGVTYNNDGSYTVRLTNGRNIVKLVSATGDEYQVLSAKPINYTIANETHPGEAITPGDKVSVVFNTLYHPCNKLAGVYNMTAFIQYNGTPNGTEIVGGSGQYTFASAVKAQTFSATIPEDWDVAQTYDLTTGAIMVKGYGDPYGGHRAITYEQGKNPNFTAVQRTAFFGAIPDISIEVKSKAVTGIEPDHADKAISVYPNPFTDYIITNSKIDAEAVISDVSGKILLKVTLKSGENRIDVSALPKGIYLFKLGSDVIKLMK